MTGLSKLKPSFHGTQGKMGREREREHNKRLRSITSISSHEGFGSDNSVFFFSNKNW